MSCGLPSADFSGVFPELAAEGFVRGNGELLVGDLLKLVGILAAAMEEQHRVWLDKARALGVAEFVANVEGMSVNRVSEAQRQLAAQVNQGVKDFLFEAILAAQWQPATPARKEGSGQDPDMTDSPQQGGETSAAGRQSKRLREVADGQQAAAAPGPPAAAEPPATAGSSSLAHEAEVQQLRQQLQERDAMVEQLRGDVAALRSIKQESCTPLMDYTLGRAG